MRRPPTSRQEPHAQQTTAVAAEQAVANGGVSPGPPLDQLDFGGYRRFHLPASELEDYDGRIEFWDGETETALQVREPNSPVHEFPSQRLAALGERIAQVRGHPILCFGTMDLALPGKDGRPGRMMQADQSLYLHPHRANLVGPKADGRGREPLPGRSAGSGLHHRHPPPQAEALRSLGLSRGVGGRAGRVDSPRRCAWRHHLRAAGRRVPSSARELCADGAGPPRTSTGP